MEPNINVVCETSPLLTGSVRSDMHYHFLFWSEIKVQCFGPFCVSLILLTWSEEEIKRTQN